jgi:hypothetical protein
MDWWTPTCRIVRWSPLACACVAALLTLALMRARSDVIADAAVVVLLPALVVVGGVAGLHDPARALLQPMPVSTLRRLGHRLTMLVPCTALALAGLSITTDALFAVVLPGPGPNALAAFGAVGVAASTALTRWCGGRGNDLAVLTLLVWVIGGVVATGIDGPRWLASSWWHAPALVGVPAVIVAIVSAHAGEAA